MIFALGRKVLCFAGHSVLVKTALVAFDRGLAVRVASGLDGFFSWFGSRIVGSQPRCCTGAALLGRCLAAVLWGWRLAAVRVDWCVGCGFPACFPRLWSVRSRVGLGIFALGRKRLSVFLFVQVVAFRWGTRHLVWEVLQKASLRRWVALSGDSRGWVLGARLWPDCCAVEGGGALWVWGWLAHECLAGRRPLEP